MDLRTEQLITRKLDGELAEGESLELNKQLIRSPEARSIMEEYELIGSLATTTLQKLLDQPRTHHSSPMTHHLRRPRGIQWATSAAAAIIIAAVLLQTPRSASGPRIEPNNGTAVLAGTSPIEDNAINAVQGPRHENERIHRDVIGVVDNETQSVYLLEMDQQQTTVVPVSMNY